LRTVGVWSATVLGAVKNGSCAIECREPCQVGNQAALSEFFNVPRGRLFRASKLFSAYIGCSNLRCMVLFDILLYLYSEECKLHQALYRKWRPADFRSVVGQDHITSVLSYEVSEGKLNHAYLFCGSRGTGKTSCAKILAKAANCKHTVDGNPCNQCESCRSIDSGSSLDVLEMDAASNTGVDYIRDIRDEVIFTPSDMSTRVYIIDEVHMLSEGAFNALLKTLEEPPSKVIFILATTELQKIPATILSRCQRFDFRRIPIMELVSRLMYIASQEGIELDEDAARLIARLAQGGMRDAISLLELCASEGGRVSAQAVGEKAGVCGREKVISVVGRIVERDYSGLFEAVSEIYRSSRDLSVFFSDILMLYRDMMVIRAMRLTDRSQIDPEILDVSDNEFADLYTLSQRFKYPVMVYHTGLLKEAIIAMNRGNDKRVIAEMTLIKMASKAEGDSNEALSARIAELEDKLARGVYSTSSAVQPNEPLALRTAASSEKVKKSTAADAPSLQQMSNADEEKVQSSPKEAPRAVRCEEYINWAEVVAAYSKRDQGGAPYLSEADAFVENGRVLVVEVYGDWACQYLEMNKAPEIILACARALGDSFDKVEIRVSANTKSKDPIDDLPDGSD